MLDKLHSELDFCMVRIPGMYSICARSLWKPIMFTCLNLINNWMLDEYHLYNLY